MYTMVCPHEVPPCEVVGGIISMTFFYIIIIMVLSSCVKVVLPNQKLLSVPCMLVCEGMLAGIIMSHDSLSACTSVRQHHGRWWEVATIMSVLFLFCSM